MISRTAFEGSRLTTIAAALIAAGGGVLWIGHGGGEAGVRAAIRLTARSSLLLFVLAFAASSAAQLLPSAFTRWQLRNRRHLGLAFAASHGLHALAILAFAQLYPLAFVERTRDTSFGGGALVYAFIVAMAATSSERAAQRLGPRAWKALHVTGGLVIWLAFVKANVVRAGAAPGYWVPTAILGTALAMRVAAWLLRRSRARLDASPFT